MSVGDVLILSTMMVLLLLLLLSVELIVLSGQTQALVRSGELE
jgi:hypothetical protein